MGILPETGDVAVIGSGVFEILAPVDSVWHSLTDFAAYGEWNPLCRHIEVEPVIGGRVRMEVHNDLEDAVVTLDYRLDALDTGRRLAWSADFPALGLTARRDQYCQPLDAARTLYWTTDLYTGPEARAQADANGAWVRAAFDGMAAALKARCEGAGGPTATDALAIQDALVCYAEAIDTGDLALFDRCFTPDARIQVGGVDHSPASYRELCTRAGRALAATQHHVGLPRLQPDSATPGVIAARTSFIATHIHRDHPGAPVTVGGTYHDRFERTAEGWRISARTGEVAWVTGDPHLIDFA